MAVALARATVGPTMVTAAELETAAQVTVAVPLRATVRATATEILPTRAMVVAIPTGVVLVRATVAPTMVAEVELVAAAQAIAVAQRVRTMALTAMAQEMAMATLAIAAMAAATPMDKGPGPVTEAATMAAVKAAAVPETAIRALTSKVIHLITGRSVLEPAGLPV